MIYQYIIYRINIYIYIYMYILSRPMLITEFCRLLIPSLLGALLQGCATKPGKAPSGVSTENLPVRSQCLNPLGYSPLQALDRCFCLICESQRSRIKHLCLIGENKRNLKELIKIKISRISRYFFYVLF